MNAIAKKNKNILARATSKERNRLLPALIAAGSACGLAAAGPVAALELGDVSVESALGQPLRASIAYALNPHEELSPFCIYLKPGTSSSGLSYLNNATVNIAGSSIVLSGTTPIREPMMAMQVSVECPYTARLAREYTLMFDLTVPVEAVTEPVMAAPVPARQPSTVTANRQPRPASVANVTPIAAVSDYEVQRGDTLSEIAARIENRKVGLWPAVYAIFEANPHAFIDNDLNRLKAGSVLSIPGMVQALPAETVAASPAVVDEGVAVSATTTPVSGTSAGYDGLGATDDAGEPSATAAGNTASLDNAAADANISATAGDSQTASGEVPLDSDNPFVTPRVPANGTTVVIPDTQIDIPAQTAPVVSSGSNSQSDSGGPLSWLFMLGGTGIAIILFLLLFGRIIRDRFSPRPMPASSDVELDRWNAGTGQKDAIAANELQPNVTDAVVLATAVGESVQSDSTTQPIAVGPVAEEMVEDLNYSSSADTAPQPKIEIPPEAFIEAEEETLEFFLSDPLSESTILESEIPPSERSGEYDVSMIVDATKIALGDGDDTNKDLMAVQLDSEDGADETDMHTFSKEIDYKILECDYEEELTATQALNAEIAKAALELAERMDAEGPGDATSLMPAIDETKVMAELDATAEVPVVDNDDTVMLSETSEVPALDMDATSEVPVVDADADATTEVPAIEIEATSEVPTIDADATSEVPAMDANLTGEIPAVAVKDSKLDETAEIPRAADHEVTAELTGRVTAEGDAENEEFGDADETVAIKPTKKKKIS